MKQTKLLRATAIAVLGLSLGAGVASAAPGDASIENTGPDSTNTVRFETDRDVDVDNDTDLKVRNDNPQRASTGDATVRHNTTGGDATTGAAMNDSLLRVRASVDNSSATAAALGGEGGGSWSGSIDTTGPDSTNRITFDSDVDIDVDNDTYVSITNDNHQSAYSGDARVSDNTTGGDATSGDASNVSTVDVTLEVTN